MRLAEYGPFHQPTSDGASECGSESSSECPEELYNLTKLAEVSLAAAAGTLVHHGPLRNGDFEHTALLRTLDVPRPSAHPVEYQVGLAVSRFPRLRTAPCPSFFPECDFFGFLQMRQADKYL